MSYEKQIHDYLSGDLSPSQEKALFDDLSSHSELRDELSLQLRMQEVVQKDLSRVVIPSATTAKIFSSLGFIAPSYAEEDKKKNRAIFVRGRWDSLFSVIALLVALTSLLYIVLLPTATTDDSKVEQALQNSTLASPSTLSSNKTTNTINRKKTQQNAARIAQTSDNTVKDQNDMIANEPIKAYLDIGKFSSVDYLTQAKIIGVADEGKIYCSEDGGKSWVLQVSKTSSDLMGVNFIDTTNGIIVGARGTILMTSNAGREWKTVSSVTGANLVTVRYATKDTVYACGAMGTIIRSVTSGMSWEKLESGATASLFKIHFNNGREGIISGEHGISFETHDAGASWLPKN